MIRACHQSFDSTISGSSSLSWMLRALKYFTGIVLLNLELNTEANHAKESTSVFCALVICVICSPQNLTGGLGL